MASSRRTERNKASPNCSVDPACGPFKDAEKLNGIPADAVRYQNEFGDQHVVCPPHTTEQKLMAKIDWRVLPALCILYILAFLDRVNIGNANVFGLTSELELGVGTKYNTALAIFFVPYILLEIPSNILLKRFKPHVWLSLCMFMFGLVSICQGFIRSYGGLLAARFFLGVFESGMFPGCFYLIGMWYKRSEAQKRFSFFSSSTTLAGAFGGLLASAIGLMSGLRGYSGWRWIFILEGILTCIVAIGFFFVLPDFPEDAKWLNEEERSYIKARLQVDQGPSGIEREIALRDVGRVFKDFKVSIGGFMYLGVILPGYSYAYFSPGIIQGYGYSPIQTQLHSVPPWAAAFVFSLLIAWLSDRVRHRFLFCVFCVSLAIVGFAMLLAINTNHSAEYAALFLVAMGVFSAVPVLVCWFTMNLGGHSRRSVGAGWQIGFGNLGAIIAVFSFLKKDAPRYTPGYGTSLAFLCLSLLGCCMYLAACVYENRKKDRTPQNLALTESEKIELGDLGPDYRYLL